MYIAYSPSVNVLGMSNSVCVRMHIMAEVKEVWNEQTSWYVEAQDCTQWKSDSVTVDIFNKWWHHL